MTADDITQQQTSIKNFQEVFKLLQDGEGKANNVEKQLDQVEAQLDILLKQIEQLEGSKSTGGSDKKA